MYKNTTTNDICVFTVVWVSVQVRISYVVVLLCVCGRVVGLVVVLFYFVLDGFVLVTCVVVVVGGVRILFDLLLVVVLCWGTCLCMYYWLSVCAG